MHYMNFLMYRFLAGRVLLARGVRSSFTRSLGSRWPKPQVLVPLSWFLLQVNASAQAVGGTGDFTTGIQKGLGLILLFGFAAGCVMVIAGFLNAKRDENWKMTVIYGIGVAGGVALMKALFNAFGMGGAAISPSWGL
jgi:hypothetical protein